MLAVHVWTLADAVGFGSPEPGAKLFWERVGSFGSTVTPAAWLILALVYAGERDGVTTRPRSALDRAARHARARLDQRAPRPHLAGRRARGGLRVTPTAVHVRDVVLAEPGLLLSPRRGRHRRHPLVVSRCRPSASNRARPRRPSSEWSCSKRRSSVSSRTRSSTTPRRPRRSSETILAVTSARSADPLGRVNGSDSSERRVRSAARRATTERTCGGAITRKRYRFRECAHSVTMTSPPAWTQTSWSSIRRYTAASLDPTDRSPANTWFSASGST